MGIKRCKRVYPDFKYFCPGIRITEELRWTTNTATTVGGKPGSASNYCRTLQRSALPKKLPVNEKPTGTLHGIVVREDR